MNMCSLNEMNDDCITGMLSSSRGRGIYDEHSASLLHDEDFCFAARQYVRKRACKKGKPNLTSQMFTKWIETEYGLSIHERTARKWLAKLDRADVVEYRDISLIQMDN